MYASIICEALIFFAFSDKYIGTYGLHNHALADELRSLNSVLIQNLE